jgi:2-polyprenyl-3-methyl-5-hydroxy-6-metoxy-1,4-benzoquinol methylase
MNENILVTCPFCCSSDNYIKYKVNADETAVELASTDDNNTISRLKEIIVDIWKDNHANWHICGNCGSGFAHPFTACNSEYYTVTYTGDVFYKEWKWEYTIAYKILKTLNSRNVQLLEIGAGNGAFVNRIAGTLIPKENILCTEFSEYGKKKIQSMGIDCVSEDILSLNVIRNKGRFSIICMFQVFEHLDNVDTIFKCINQISNSDAQLFIAVPSNKHRNFYFSINKRLDFPPGHLSCITPEGMDFLANRHGWQVIKNYYQPTKKRFQILSLLSKELNTKSKFLTFSNRIKLNSVRKFITFIYMFVLTIQNFDKIYRLIFTRVGVSHFFWLKKNEYSKSLITVI